MSEWYPFDEGRSIGQTGSENGVIIGDEEYPIGARITLERDGYAPFTITCGIYGWMVHTRFFADSAVAHSEMAAMKDEIAAILEYVMRPEGLTEDALKNEIAERIASFVEHFP